MQLGTLPISARAITVGGAQACYSHIYIYMCLYMSIDK